MFAFSVCLSVCLSVCVCLSTACRPQFLTQGANFWYVGSLGWQFKTYTFVFWNLEIWPTYGYFRSFLAILALFKRGSWEMMLKSEIWDLAFWPTNGSAWCSAHFPVYLNSLSLKQSEQACFENGLYWSWKCGKIMKFFDKAALMQSKLEYRENGL